MTMNTIKCINLLLVVFAVNAFLSNAVAREINIYWSGKVDGIVEFKDNALPSGITVGDKIYGTLRCDQEFYDHESSILGNIDYGNVYTYFRGLNQSIHIGKYNWVLDSGDITLSSSFFSENGDKVLDVFTYSGHPFHEFSYIEFPNHVEEFEIGFAIGDDRLPLNFFDTYLLNEANFNINEVTWGGGIINTRTWNSDRDIIDGYYISFVISEVRLASDAKAPIVTGRTQTNDTTPTWSWESSGGGNGKYRYRLDKSSWTVARVTSFTPASELPEGRYTLYVQESDADGRWSASGVKSIVIDLTPPAPPKVSVDTLSNDIAPSWNWISGGGGNGKYRYRLDKSTWTVARVTSYTPATALSAGSHILRVQEADAAGNWSVSGVKSILIDTP